MRTHLGCVGRVNLGKLGEDTRKGLEQVESTWLEFSTEPPSLVVRHAQPADTPVLPNVASELLEFLGKLTDAERAGACGGALYCLDEDNGQYARIKVSSGGFVTVAWARPDYSRARWLPYHGERVPVVFEAYQRLNGAVKFRGRSAAPDQIKAVTEQYMGFHLEGEFEARAEEGRVEIRLRDLNSSVLPLVAALREVADPLSSLEGEIEVSSFRPGDLEDYCRFAFSGEEVWLVRPSLWSELAQEGPTPARTLEAAA